MADTWRVKRCIMIIIIIIISPKSVWRSSHFQLVLLEVRMV